MATLKLILSSVGNPDHGQNPNRSISPKQTIEITAIKDAPKICRDYIEENCLGGGNWTGGQIVHSTKGEVARVSYNGRVWRGEWPNAIELTGEEFNKTAADF